MIAGYAKYGHGLFATVIFESMQQQAIECTRVSLSGALKSCSAIRQGRCIHECIITAGLELDEFVVSALIHMYVKYGSLEEAHRVLDKFPNRNLVIWNSIIMGHAWYQDGLAALGYYSKMQQEGLHADKATYLSLLKACGRLGMLGLGKELHDDIIISGLGSDLAVGTSLVSMYGKCGSLDAAQNVFDNLPKQSVVLLNALIAGYALHGKQHEALQFSNESLKQGLQSDNRTCTIALDACYQVGKVEDAHVQSEVMKEKHGVTPGIEQFNCFVDLLSRSGFLLEAEELLWGATNPFDITGWTSLLFACRNYGNFELGHKCFQQLVSMNLSCAASIAPQRTFSDVYIGLTTPETALKELKSAA